MMRFIDRIKAFYTANSEPMFPAPECEYQPYDPSKDKINSSFRVVIDSARPREAWEEFKLGNDEYNHARNNDSITLATEAKLDADAEWYAVRLGSIDRRTAP